MISLCGGIAKESLLQIDGLSDKVAELEQLTKDIFDKIQAMIHEENAEVLEIMQRLRMEKVYFMGGIFLFKKKWIGNVEFRHLIHYYFLFFFWGGGDHL